LQPTTIGLVPRITPTTPATRILVTAIFQTTIRRTTIEFVPSGDNTKIIDYTFTVSDLFQAYYDCRKNKRNTWNALKFEEHLEKNLMDLYYDLIENKYEIDRSICFVVTKPKPREIWAADFRDRIVHHLVYNKFFNTFSKTFIHDSYACLPDKGTLKASQRLEHFVRSCSNNYQNKTYFLKADISNFFMSIDKNILFELIKEKVKHDWWLNIIHKIIFNECIKNVYVKSDESLLKLIPKHKSLFNVPKNCGLPIGNLSSQFFANIYLNELDNFVKRKLKCKYYVRYVDDIVMLHNSPKILNEFYEQICNYTESKLKVRFNPRKKEINTIDKGINFVGYITKPYRKYLRRTTIKNIYDTEKVLKNHQQSLNSYFGMLIHADAYNERIRIKNYYSKYGIKFNLRLTKVI
jgi:RNA-directed DNA polymerase